MVEKLGIEKTEKIIGLLADVGADFHKALGDGKFDVGDVAYFIPLLGDFSPAVSALSGVGAELADLSVAEILQLVDFAVGKLGDVVSGKAAAVVKQGMIVAVEVAKLVSVIKA